MKTLQGGALKLGIDLTAGQLSAFETYYAELVAWNKVHHLTAITSYHGVQVKHFLDSLTCVQGLVPPAPSMPNLLPQFPPWRVLDVGSGAGFPGLPLKICFPQFRFIAQKKAGIDDEIRGALAALAALGGFLRGQIPVVLPGTEPRQLVVVDKVKATPDLYPRRTGVPAKKPLK
ncbi:MAG: class I SAM-dependent methyltransferase [Chloroflexi bacterium]|nr:class I SAM-dependent methyltransferase [Chloroflexota bacterium]